MKHHLLILCLTAFFALIVTKLSQSQHLKAINVPRNYSSFYETRKQYSSWLTPPNYRNSTLRRARNVQNEQGSGVSPRESRFLSLFTVVRFDNGQCLGSSGDNGTCYPSGECIRRGGAANGRCAKGYGVCCVFSKSCGATTFQNNTYFTHNGFSAGSSGDGTTTCSITVFKSTKDVCQYRLDFDSFNIGKPNMNGVCVSDQFSISGSTTVIPPICGLNSGNHMYIDVGPGNIPVTITVTTSGQSIARTWKIKIVHVRCDSETRALNGCLQYFTGVSGTIRTYNFDFAGGQQLANQDYTACIRTERNFCGIRYSACPDIQIQTGSEGGAPTLSRSRSFTITENPNENYRARVGTQNCMTDWVIIPCATNNGRIMQASTICQDRICGNLFNSDNVGSAAPVFSYVRPFRIVYHTDGTEPVATDLENRGFCLNYVQQPCAPQQ